jgi:hypothetical protein
MRDPMNTPRPPVTFSYSAVWADAMRMLAANAGLIAAIAGAFLFLPGVIEARFFPPPPFPGFLPGADVTGWQGEMRVYFRANWLWMLLSTTLYFAGIIATYLLLLAQPRITVGAAVARSMWIMPFYLVLSFIVSLAVGFGFLLLIVPGIFLLGRLLLSTPILLVETPRAPITAIRESWTRSAGTGWLIAGLVLIVYFASGLASVAVRVGLGTIILLLLGPNGVGGLLLAIVHAAVTSLLVVLIIVLTAAIYRNVGARPAAVAPAS